MKINFFKIQTHWIEKIYPEVQLWNFKSHGKDVNFEENFFVKISNCFVCVFY